MPGLSCKNETNPARIGTSVFSGNDLDCLSVLDLGAQGDEAPIDLRSDAPIADIGMHAVGKINTGRSAWKAQNIALGREHINVIREQIDLYMLHELFRIRRGLHLADTGEPFARPNLRWNDFFILGFVLPVSSDTGFGHPVHFLGANLYFDRNAVWPEQRCVQGLIAVNSRDRNIVLESSGYRIVNLVNDSEGAVTVIWFLHG